MIDTTEASSLTNYDPIRPSRPKALETHLMDDVHLLTARHFRYELRRGGKIFSSKFVAREVCIAPQETHRRGVTRSTYYFRNPPREADLTAHFAMDFWDITSKTGHCGVLRKANGAVPPALSTGK